MVSVEGAYVFITDRRQSELEKAKAIIGKNVSIVQGDVAKLEDLDRLWATVKREKGGVDVIVANADFVERVTLSQGTPEHFDHTFTRSAPTLVERSSPFRRLFRFFAITVLSFSCHRA
jgi:NAD(P)-dependent dehydrogenase (short-subunit alcohol dehydrogenase family)